MAKGPKCNLIKLERLKFKKKNKSIKTNKILISDLFKKKIEFDDQTLALQKLINSKFKTNIFKFTSGFNGICCIIPERIKKIKNKELRGMGEIYLNEMIISRNKLNTYNLIVCDISKLRSYKKFLELVKKIKKKFLKSTKSWM